MTACVKTDREALLPVRETLTNPANRHRFIHIILKKLGMYEELGTCLLATNEKGWEENMDRHEKIDNLIRLYRYNIQTATAYVDANGFCAYCGEDVFASEGGFCSAQIDHLFPQSIYPDLKNDPLNCVYSCFRCNQLKRSLDPKELFVSSDITAKDPRTVLTRYRNDLISSFRLRFAPIRAKDKETYHETVSLLRSQ